MQKFNLTIDQFIVVRYTGVFKQLVFPRKKITFTRFNIFFFSFHRRGILELRRCFIINPRKTYIRALIN